MEIPTVDSLVWKGLEMRVTEVFGCSALVSTAYEKVRLLAKRGEGRQLKYPYAFIIPRTLTGSTVYGSAYLARHGQQFAVTENQESAWTVRLLPAQYQVDIEFYTDRGDLRDEASAFALARRWLFARRLGYLKFNVDYGKLSLPIAVEMDESIQIPERPNQLEQQSEYVLTSSLRLQGWVSEPPVHLTGVVQSVEADATLGEHWSF